LNLIAPRADIRRPADCNFRIERSAHQAIFGLGALLVLAVDLEPNGGSHARGSQKTVHAHQNVEQHRLFGALWVHRPFFLAILYDKEADPFQGALVQYHRRKTMVLGYFVVEIDAFVTHEGPVRQLGGSAHGLSAIGTHGRSLPMMQSN
jgi:hypothetical protein